METSGTLGCHVTSRTNVMTRSPLIVTNLLLIFKGIFLSEIDRNMTHWTFVFFFLVHNNPIIPTLHQFKQHNYVINRYTSLFPT